MAVRQPPAFLAGVYSAQALRAYGMLPWAQDPAAASVLRPMSGIIPRGAALDCAISQAGSTITVGPLAAIIAGTEAAQQHGYEVINETSWSVAIPSASTSQTRLDRIVVRVRDAAYSTSFSDADLALVQGVGATSNAQLPAEPVNAHTIATVSTTGTGTPVVTPTWRYTTPPGGIRPARGGTVDDSVAPRWPGEYRDLAGRLQRGAAAGGTWVDIASVAAFAEETATLLYEGAPGAGQGGTIGMGGAGKVQTCRYQIFGKRAYLWYVFVFGAAPVGGGTGTIYTTLPAAVSLRAGGEQHLFGRLRTYPSGDYPLCNWPVTAECLPGGGNVLFRVPVSATDCRLEYMRSVDPNNIAAGTGFPRIPNGFPVAPLNRLEVQGWVEIA